MRPLCALHVLVLVFALVDAHPALIRRTSDIKDHGVLQPQSLFSNDAQEEVVQMHGSGRLQSKEVEMYNFALNPPMISRSFIGADPTVNTEPCNEDKYDPSEMETQFVAHAEDWLEQDFQDYMRAGEYVPEHCRHLTNQEANDWISQNTNGKHDPKIFSKVCRKGQPPQYIEPLAGLLRDPRHGCNASVTLQPCFLQPCTLLSVDWLVFPSSKVTTSNAKARFYDAGGSRFNDATKFFVETYKGHGIVFDKVYAWDVKNCTPDEYWADVEPEIRKFWEPRVTFYGGIGVTDERNHTNNPVSRLYNDCKPEDFCAFKLDIDTPPIEAALSQQLLDMPEETKAKLDEFFFEQHVHGWMQKWWDGNVQGTYADSYKLFGSLRSLGVRAHSWV